MIREVALEFRNGLLPRTPAPKMIKRESPRTVPHYELATEAINEFIAVVGDALSEHRPVVLRGFGKLIPRRYKPMTVRLPGARPDDDKAVFTVPVRLGVLFRPSPKLKKAIREHGRKNTASNTEEPGS